MGDLELNYTTKQKEWFTKGYNDAILDAINIVDGSHSSYQELLIDELEKRLPKHLRGLWRRTW